MKIAHIIHPVVVSKESDLYQAQPITFQSMQNARQHAEGKVNIELYACKYSDEETLIPGDYDFQYTRDLDRHIALLKKFRIKRKLATLQDVLERLYQATDADYLIYTNADIALVPHFYISIQYLIDQGYDAFAISCRTVPDTISDINLLYTFAGVEHEGADCFVFKRELYPLMRLNNICIGTQRPNDALQSILTRHAQNFAWFQDMHLTFHLGDDKRAIRPKIKHWLLKHCVPYILKNEWCSVVPLMSDQHLLNTSHDTKDARKKTVNTKIAHIINPVVVSKESDLYQAQPITFQSMQNARQYAEDKVNIELYACKYSDEKTLIPDDYDFQYTRDLDRHIAMLKKFRTKRTFPILQDILERLYEATDADYLIYTNADIALVPHFYISIQYLIDRGYDAFGINRRTVPDTTTDVNLLYTLAGKRHEGIDCFVFKRELYPLIRLNNVCIGAQWPDLALMAILICHAQNFAWFRDMHLTFHLGDNKNWSNDREYANHNQDELTNILDTLKADGVYKHDSSLLNALYYRHYPPKITRPGGRIKRAIKHRTRYIIHRRFKC